MSVNIITIFFLKFNYYMIVFMDVHFNLEYNIFRYNFI